MMTYAVTFIADLHVFIKPPFSCEPVWCPNDVILRNVETMEILGNEFNSKGNNTTYVDNRRSAGNRFMV